MKLRIRKLFGLLLGMYKQDIQSLARRELAGQDMALRIEFIAEIYEVKSAEVRADIEGMKARWARSDRAMEKNLKSRKLHRLFAEKTETGEWKYRFKGESWSKFYKRYKRGEVKFDEQGGLK